MEMDNITFDNTVTLFKVDKYIYRTYSKLTWKLKWDIILVNKRIFKCSSKKQSAI